MVGGKVGKRKQDEIKEAEEDTKKRKVEIEKQEEKEKMGEAEERKKGEETTTNMTKRGIIRTESKIEENTVWNLILEKTGIRGFAVASTSSFHKSIWDSHLLSLSEDIYTHMTFTGDNEQYLLSLARKCPKARVVCILYADPEKKMSPSASEMEVKLADPAFSNVFVTLDTFYGIDHETHSHILEHLHTIGGKRMREEGSITSQLLDKCKNIREIDTSFVNFNLYSLWGAGEGSEARHPPPVLPPVKFSLPHLQSIKLSSCLLFNHSMKRLLQGTGSLTQFEATDISDYKNSPASLRFQLLPLLQNKQLTSLSLRTRPQDCYYLSKEILEGLKVMKLKELRLYGCHHGCHEGDIGDYGSGDDYRYDREAHNVDIRFLHNNAGFDSDPNESEIELVEDMEHRHERRQTLLKQRRLTTDARKSRLDKLKIDEEESLIDSIAQFLYSQRLSLTTLELGHLLGTTPLLKALYAIHTSSSSSSSSSCSSSCSSALSAGVFPHVTQLYLTAEDNDNDCCSMTAEGMSLLATLFPSVVKLCLTGDLTQEWINGIIINPFASLKVLDICLCEDAEDESKIEKCILHKLKPTYGDLEYILCEED